MNEATEPSGTAGSGIAGSLSRRLQDDPSYLGPRLMAIGRGPLAIPGAVGGVLALDDRGTTVLLAIFSSIPAGASGALADELDRLASYSGDEIGQLANSLALGGSLGEAHAAFFDGAAVNLKFNRDQRAIVVATDEPTDDAWRDLVADLGPQLGGVFVMQEGSVLRISRPDSPPAGARGRSGHGGLLALIALALLAGVAIGKFLNSPTEAVSQHPSSQPVEVGAGGSPASTHTNWIGQRRIVRLFSGHLVAGYAGSSGLHLVSDRANLGRSWEQPQIVPGIRPGSFALASDQHNRIHLAFRDDEGVGFAVIRETADGYVATPVLRLDGAGDSPVVDVTFDPSRSIAHVLWVNGNNSQQPHWAAISVPPNEDPVLMRSESFAEAGGLHSVLVNVAAGPQGTVTATFRNANSSSGWFARHLEDTGPEGLSWSRPEAIPTADALYGAATLAIDRVGEAHLVLRDNTTYGLTYLRRDSSGAWAAIETVIDADSTEEIDFPMVSPDSVSGAIFVFFQDTTKDPAGAIMVATRDPAAGWSEAEQVAQGQFPVSPEAANGVATAIFTNVQTGEISSVNVGLP